MSTVETKDDATTSPAPDNEAEADVAAATTASQTPSIINLLTKLQFVYTQKTVFFRKELHVRLEFSLQELSAVMTEADGAAVGAHNHHKPLKLQWEDVLGAHILTQDGVPLSAPVDPTTVSNANTYVLGVFACPTKHNKPKLHKRQLMEWFFRFSGTEMANVLEVQKWINYLADPRANAAVEKATELGDLTPEVLPKRKFLVVVNPVGGSGKGVPTYEDKVAPIFRYANIDAELKITERAKHGEEIVAAMPLNVYDCVIAVGGDGSLYELVQGLMQRSDWNYAIRQPLGLIPTGSGNGLSHSIMHQCQERTKPINAAFVLVKGSAQELDVASVRNDKEIAYSFLSLEWAGIADIDIESERLRLLGGLRFPVTFLHHMLFVRKEYPGKISYLDEGQEGDAPELPRYFDTHDPNSATRPVMDVFDNPKETERLSGKWKEISGTFRVLWIMNVTHAAADVFLAPHAEFDDGYNYITLVSGTHPRNELMKLFLAVDSGKHIENDAVQQVRTRAFKVEPERPTDLLCVDGELFDGPKLEAQVHRGLARIITLRRDKK